MKMESSAKPAPAATPIELANGVEGTVTFEPHPDTVYRYKVVASQDKLRIWLENSQTKQQWQTADLEMKDFLREGLVIPLATFRDYVQFFVTCLEAAPSSTGFSRELIPSTTTSDAMEMRLTLMLRALDTTWSPSYTFVLLPVPLALVDLLGSKVRDQADEIMRLHKKVEELSARFDAASGLFARGNLIKDAYKSDILLWEHVRTPGAVTDLVQFHADGGIQFTRGGVFVVSGILKYSGDGGALVELFVEKSLVLTLHGGTSASYYQTLAFSHVLTVQPGDKLRVVTHGNNPVFTPSTITVYTIG